MAVRTKVGVLGREETITTPKKTRQGTGKQVNTENSESSAASS